MHIAVAYHLSRAGEHDATHPRDRGRLQEPDPLVFARAVAEDRIIVTENADDFQKLAAGVDLYPGLIILPSVAKAEAQRLMDLIVAHILGHGGVRPADLLINSVLSIDADDSIRISPLP